MRARLIPMCRSPWPLLAGLCLLVMTRALPAGMADAAAPMMVTVLAVVALGLALAAAVVCDGVADVGLGFAFGCSVGERGLVRQCDPDAAGRVRSRAPDEGLLLAGRGLRLPPDGTACPGSMGEPGRRP